MYSKMADHKKGAGNTLEEEACPSWNKTLDSRQQSPKLNML
jgi:hypothetical protein